MASIQKIGKVSISMFSTRSTKLLATFRLFYMVELVFRMIRSNVLSAKVYLRSMSTRIASLSSQRQPWNIVLLEKPLRMHPTLKKVMIRVSFSSQDMKLSVPRSKRRLSSSVLKAKQTINLCSLKGQAEMSALSFLFYNYNEYKRQARYLSKKSPSISLPFPLSKRKAAT